MTLVRCGWGLGNRVAAMANGLSYSPAGIEFSWKVNRHCPVRWEEVFPGGVPGVRFVDAPAGWATRFEGRICHEWAACGDRQRADAAYARIMEAMAGWPAMRPDVAVVGRFFRKDGDPRFLGDVAAAAVEPGDAVFVFADRFREVIAGRLIGTGASITLPKAPELVEDLMRSREEVLTFLDDWATLMASGEIVAMDGPTSLLHPARAMGIPIRYAEVAA